MKTIDYHLKGIDKGLWTAAKRKADANGQSLKFVLLSLLRTWLEKGNG